MDSDSKIYNLKDLKIWQKSMDLVELIYKTSSLFPKQELYGLTSQMRRSSISIPSNIAEGFARYHNKEYKQFLYISLGSLSELKTQVLIAQRLGYSKEDKINNIIEKIDIISKMTTNLIKKINAQ